MIIPSGFRKIDTYVFYDSYEDLKTVIVSDNGDVTVPEENKDVLKGEENSQYITFDIPRYYDGIDLTKMLIRIHWVNEQNKIEGGGYAGAVNGICNPERIRIGWIIDSAVTEIEGPVTFQLEAIGTNEKDETYVKKSKYGTLNVLPSFITGSSVTKPTDEWYKEFVANMQSMITQAQGYATDAREKALEAWTRTDDVTGKKYKLGIENGVPYFEEIAVDSVIP